MTQEVKGEIENVPRDLFEAGESCAGREICRVVYDRTARGTAGGRWDWHFSHAVREVLREATMMRVFLK